MDRHLTNGSVKAWEMARVSDPLGDRPAPP
jgi:hypothetical protein